MHSLIQISSKNPADNVSLSIKDVHFEHVRFKVYNISLNLMNCTFLDSSVNVYFPYNSMDFTNNKHKWLVSSSFNITQCEWSNVTNTTVLATNYVKQVNMTNIRIVNTFLDNDLSKAVVLYNIDSLNMNSVTMSENQMQFHNKRDFNHFWEETKFVVEHFCFMYVSYRRDSFNQLRVNIHMKDIKVSDTSLELYGNDWPYRDYGNVICAVESMVTLVDSLFEKLSVGTALRGSGGLNITNVIFSSIKIKELDDGIIMWHTGYRKTVVVTSSRFHDGGPVNIVPSKNSIVTFRNCQFIGNGAAVKIADFYQREGLQKNLCANDVTTFIENTTFASNVINISSHLISIRTNLTIYNTTFLDNYIPWGEIIKISGMGADCMVKFNMKNVRFYNNTGEYYEPTLDAEWTRFDISDMDLSSWSSVYAFRKESNQAQQAISGRSLITLKHSHGYLTDSNFNFNLATHRNINSPFPQHIEYVHVSPVPQINKIENQFSIMHTAMQNITFICPRNYMATLTELGTGLDCYINYTKDNEPWLETDCTFKEFIRSCILPSPGFYLVGRGSYKKNLTNETYINNNPKPCPIPSANCTEGIARPMDGFWGPLVEKNTARFIKCIPGFCCSGSSCVDNTSCSIENNRGGILCTDCIKGYSHSLFGEKCISNDECGYSWPLFVIPAVTLIIVAVSAFGLLNVVTKAIGHVMLVSRKITGMKRVLQKLIFHQMAPYFNTKELGKKTNVTQDGKSNSFEVSNSNTPNGRANGNARIAFLMCIIYYVQDVTLYYVDLTPYTNPFLKNILNKRFIRDVFSLNAEIIEEASTHSCAIVGLSPVFKVILHLFFYYLISLSFGIAYTALFGLFPFCTRPAFCKWLNKSISFRSLDIKANLGSGFVLVTLLCYQKITTLALTLVNCVKVNSNVLLIDSGVDCSETKPVWIYIALSILPFPIYVTLILRHLKRKRISLPVFFFGLVFPGAYFLFITFIYIQRRITQLCCQRISTTSDVTHDCTEDDVILNDVINDDAIIDGVRQCDNNENSCATFQVNSGDRSQTIPSDVGEQQLIEVRGSDLDLHCSLGNCIQGGYKTYLNGWVNSQGVVRLFRVLLIYLSVFIQDPVDRIGSMLAVSLTTFSLYCLLKPCTSRALNTLSILCQACIITVGICYLILATLQRNQYLPPEEDPISGGLRLTIHVLSVILPALGILMVLLDCVLSILVYLGKGVYKVGNLIVRKM